MLPSLSVELAVSLASFFSLQSVLLCQGGDGDTSDTDVSRMLIPNLFWTWPPPQLWSVNLNTGDKTLVICDEDIVFGGKEWSTIKEARQRTVFLFLKPFEGDGSPPVPLRMDDTVLTLDPGTREITEWFGLGGRALGRHFARWDSHAGRIRSTSHLSVWTRRADLRGLPIR